MGRFDGSFVQMAKSVGSYALDHKGRILVVGLVIVLADDICTRVYHKRERKAFEENALKQQRIVRMHEAEINILKSEAACVQKAVEKIDQLEQIVNGFTEGAVNE